MRVILFAFWGQSGCGKSTFLRLVAGLEKAKSDFIVCNGSKISGTSLNRSVVFQDYGLFPWMSAGDNITTVFFVIHDVEGALYLST